MMIFYKKLLLLNCLVSFTVILFFPSGLWAENIPNKTIASGLYYTIQKGDTLWDISQRFFDSPWQWPDLWKENSQIPNPHRIFPGERIRLYRKKWVAVNPDKVIKKDRFISKTPQDKKIEKTKSYYTYNAIDQVGFIKKNPDKPYGIILKSKEDKELISSGDIVYIQSAGKKEMPLFPGSRYVVYRMLSPTKDNKSIALIGVQHYLTGVVRILEKNSRFAVARVIKSYRPIHKGDFLMPHISRSPKIRITKSQKALHGKIIVSEEHNDIMAENSIAFINKGEIDGVKPGQTYSVYYQEKKQVYSKPKESVLLSLVDIGSLLVLHTEKTTATVVITGSKKSIPPGATIRSAYPH